MFWPQSPATRAANILATYWPAKLWVAKYLATYCPAIFRAPRFACESVLYFIALLRVRSTWDADAFVSRSVLLHWCPEVKENYLKKVWGQSPIGPECKMHSRSTSAASCWPTNFSVYNICPSPNCIDWISPNHWTVGLIWVLVRWHWFKIKFIFKSRVDRTSQNKSRHTFKW